MGKLFSSVISGRKLEPDEMASWENPDGSTGYRLGTIRGTCLYPGGHSTTTPIGTVYDGRWIGPRELAAWGGGPASLGRQHGTVLEQGLRRPE
jgi:hypothetical protein